VRPPTRTIAHGRSAPPTAGFTLIEMTMVIVVIGILAAATVPLLINSFRAYETNQTNLVTLSKLRYATERMAREIREVRYSGGVYAMNLNTTAPQFTKSDGTVVTITSAPPLATLQYSTPAMTATLTNQVQLAPNGLQFDYFDINDSNVGVTTATVAYVDVTLTLTDPNSGAAAQRTRIALRNH
jgi:MSHA biogenesis protein MshO